VLAPYLGTLIIDQYGFATLWYCIGILAIITAAGFYFAIRWMEIDDPLLLSPTNS